VKISRGWIGFDLDGTLAFYDGWQGVTHIGAPIMPMVDLVRSYLGESCYDVKIFTARVAIEDPNELQEVTTAIQNWCIEHIGIALPITNRKDFAMVRLYDDRCMQVETNTGKLIEPEF